MDTPPGPAEILAAMQTAVLVVDPHGRIVEANSAAEATINMSAASLKRRALSDVVSLPPGYDPESDAPFAAFDVELQRRGGTIHGDLTAVPLPERIGWRLITIHSAAAAYRMGHRLDQAGGRRSAIAMAAMLAHEIKNPLSGIRGAAQLIESHANEDDARMTRLIRSEVDRVTALVDQMEGFTDTRALPLGEVNIHEAIDHAREVATRGFAANVSIVDAYDPSLPPVHAHRDSLVQILLNLLKNAAETAAPEAKRTIRITTAYRHGVSIAVGETGKRRPLPIEVCIIDDGPGAPPELVEALFDPFVSSKQSGRGLGLALADKLMRDMGGILQYAREGEPEMTVFRLLLPRASASTP